MPKISKLTIGLMGLIWLGMASAVPPVPDLAPLLEKQKTEERVKQQEARQAEARKKAQRAVQEERDRQEQEARDQQERANRAQQKREEQARKEVAERAARERQVRQPYEPEMIAIPSGSFEMGCKDGRDKDCYGDEKPVHTVNVGRFELGKTEVTQGQWQAVMGSNPSSFKDCGDTCPVEQVSWDDVQQFIQKLNAQTGKQYRLPSEAEWEYACRAGQSQTYCGSNDVNAVAWYTKNSVYKTHPVGGKQSNAFGLYDMSGNVWEWVHDTDHGTYSGAPTDGSAWEGSRAGARVLRGGSWGSNPQYVRAANRVSSTASNRDFSIGFRLARTLP